MFDPQQKSAEENRPSRDFAARMFVLQICDIDLAEKNSVELRRLDEIALATHAAASQRPATELNHVTRALLLLFALYKLGMSSGNPGRRREISQVHDGIRFLTHPVHAEADETIATHIAEILEEST